MKIFRYLRFWIDRFFANEESFFLFSLLAITLLVVIFMGSTLVPLFAALIFSFLLQGIVTKLIGLSLPHRLAVNITFTLFIGCVFAALIFFIPLMGKQLNAFVGGVPSVVAQIQATMNELPVLYPTMISENQVTTWIEFIESQLQQGGQWLLTASLDLLPNLFTLVVYLVLVPILVYFLLLDGASLLQFMQSLLPKNQGLLLRVGREMNSQIANYIRGKAIEILVVTAVTYICFLALGLNYALILSVLVGLSVLVPFVGAAVVTAPIAFTGLLQWGWSSDTVWLLVVYGIIQLLDGNVLVPLLFSGAVNLHPVTIIVAVLVFGGIWGFWGVFFAIPLATLVKAVYQAWPAPSPEVEEGAKAA